MKTKTKKAVLFIVLIGILSLLSYLFQEKNDLQNAQIENKPNVTTKLHCDRIKIHELSRGEFVVCLNESGWLYNQTYLLLPEAMDRDYILSKVDSIRSLAIEEGWYLEEWDEQIYYSRKE
jgi:hypothetical protein